MEETVQLKRETYDQFKEMELRMFDESETFWQQWGGEVRIWSPEAGTSALKKALDEAKAECNKLREKLNPPKRPNRWQRLKAAW